EVGLFQNGMIVGEKRTVLKNRFAAFGVTDQIVIRTVCNAFNLIELLAFLTLRKKTVQEVRRRFRVMGEFLRLLRVLLEVLRLDSVFVIPADAVGDPAAVPLLVLSGHDEEFDLHLLELANSKDEILRRDFVSIRLTDLRNSKRQLTVR